MVGDVTTEIKAGTYFVVVDVTYFTLNNARKVGELIPSRTSCFLLRKTFPDHVAYMGRTTNAYKILVENPQR
jgi:hypothetical protein